ncbi:MAG: riboflavin synthase [bacterium]
MFSGIISAIAKIKKKEIKNKSLFLTIQTPTGWELKPGDSVCSDGACLTVKEVDHDDYTTELMPETLNKTYFADSNYQYINLERSLKLNDFLDGHLVTGHVDAMGKITKIIKQGDSKIYQICFPEKFSKYVADKGSVCVDGISLTVVECKENWLTVALVDYTLTHTTIGQKTIGDLVHLEFDIIAKYLSKLISESY